MSKIPLQLLALSQLGKEELRKTYNIFLSGVDHGISWACIQRMKEYGFITQEEMDYIVL